MLKHLESLRSIIKAFPRSQINFLPIVYKSAWFFTSLGTLYQCRQIASLLSPKVQSNSGPDHVVGTKYVIFIHTYLHRNSPTKKLQTESPPTPGKLTYGFTKLSPPMSMSIHD